VPTTILLYPLLEKIYFFPSYASFLKIKCILIIQGDLALVLQVFMYHVFIKLSSFPPLLTHCLSPYSPNIQQVTIQCIILYSYMHGLFQYFLFSNISPTSYSFLRQTH
jgi:hypothetical protein